MSTDHRQQPPDRARAAHRILLPALLLAVLACGERPARADGDGPITVKFQGGYVPDRPEDSATRRILDLVKEDPRLDPQPWGGIQLPQGGFRPALMMSIAGNTAPDIYYCWFHIIRNDIENRFLHPLNEWIGDDLDGNGQIDDDEAKWEGWKRVPPLWRRVATKDGKVYGIPYAGVWYYGLLYRKDLVAQAGLDPDQPPETWDEFFYWCQKLTAPEKQFEGAEVQRGQRGFAIQRYPWAWLPWMQSAGGSPIVQIRTSPATGREYVFPMEATSFVAEDTGENLGGVPSTWKANFDSPEGVAAAAFYHQLMWAPWIKDPETGEPITLGEEDAARGRVRVGDREVAFDPGAVVRGVGRGLIGQAENPWDLINRGEVAILFANAEQLEQLSRNLNLPPELVGIMPFPARDADHKSVMQAHKHFWVMTEGVGRRPPEERERVWKCLQTLVSEQVRDDAIRKKVLSGNARWCRPDDLKRLGFDDYLEEVPAIIRRNYERIGSGEVVERTEPFAGFWQAASDLLDLNVLSFILSETGKDFDYETALREVTRDANTGLMFAVDSEQMNRKRPAARVIFAVAVALLGTAVVLILRDKAKPAGGARTNTSSGWSVIPWLMLAPALLSIGVWRYYPLFRGVVMAFQDYKIVGSSPWVGLDNFIAVATDPNFWFYVRVTLKFVGLMILLSFLAPIALAFLFTEVPRGKVFFRTLFFLPQMTSGLVVALIWKMMYDPTENGILNRMLASIGIGRQLWLQDPAWAMICCILPGVWAGAGLASLIYVAALGSLPKDYYEAAALDGAGLLSRIRHVALPQIMPLVVINFVGAFIAAFQGMAQIFLLTFGGPGKETMVLGLAIWKEAYNNLRFSTATTMAWFLGVGLIGFTYFQIRFLRRVEFRRAGEN